MRAAVFAAVGVVLRHSDVTAVGALPGRDAMAPPELTRDAPVAHAVHPLIVRAVPLSRDPVHASGF